MKKKSKKVDNSILNLWVINEECSIEQIKVPINLRGEFVRNFGVEKLSLKSEVESWLKEKETI